MKPVTRVISKYVVSNANVYDTFTRLVGKDHLPENYISDLDSLKIGPATFIIFLGLNNPKTNLIIKGLAARFAQSVRLTVVA